MDIRKQEKSRWLTIKGMYVKILKDFVGMKLEAK